MRADFPLPDLSEPLTAGYWEAAARGELAIPRCAACSHWVWYPAAACPVCGEVDMPWTPTRGRGELYAWTTVHHTFLPQYADLVPYTVGVVTLDEDALLRIPARLLADPDILTIGMAMQVHFEPLVFAGVTGSVRAPCFRPDRAVSDQT
jgi:uncharacterized OB-fold protein